MASCNQLPLSSGHDWEWLYNFNVDDTCQAVKMIFLINCLYNYILCVIQMNYGIKISLFYAIIADVIDARLTEWKLTMK